MRSRSPGVTLRPVPEATAFPPNREYATENREREPLLAMIRAVLAATLALGACGRGQGVDDRDLGGLVIAPKSAQAIVLDRAVKDPAELARALAQPHHTWGLGPHTVAISTASTVEEAGKPVESLSDHTTLELGDQGAFHA